MRENESAKARNCRMNVVMIACPAKDEASAMLHLSFRGRGLPCDDVALSKGPKRGVIASITMQRVTGDPMWLSEPRIDIAWRSVSSTSCAASMSKTRETWSRSRAVAEYYRRHIQSQDVLY